MSRALAAHAELRRHLPALVESTDPALAWYDQFVLLADCMARNRAATEWMAVVDHDEYLALDSSVPWTASQVADELRSLPAKATGADLQMAWIDPGRFPHLPAARLAEHAPSLDSTAIDRITRMTQAIDAYWFDYRRGTLPYWKVCHRAAAVLSSAVHCAARTVAQDETWEHGTAELPLWTPELFRHQSTSPGRLRVHHVRRIHEVFVPTASFSPFPLSGNIVHFWGRLAARLEAYADWAS